MGYFKNGSIYWLCKSGPFFFRIGIMTSLLFGSGELRSDNCNSSSIFSFSFCCCCSSSLFYANNEHKFQFMDDGDGGVRCEK